MIELKDVGSRIRWVVNLIIECRFVTRAGLRKKLECSEKAFDALLKGDVEPESETILKLSRLYNIDTGWILSGERMPFLVSGGETPKMQKALEKLEEILWRGGERAEKLAMLVETLYTAVEVEKKLGKYKIVSHTRGGNDIRGNPHRTF